jgi:predicted AAA+ superfamily ATPase
MIEKYNFHWREGFLYNFPKKREIFNKLIDEIKTRQIISLTGIRRTGKSVLLKQIIDYLISVEKVKRENILFYSFDEEQPKIDDIIKEYESKTAKDILKENTKIYIFLDEIQKLENWQNQIKYYYDNYSNIKFFVSGSSSLFIKKKTRESLAGRIYEFTLYPLSFREFLIFRDKEEFVEKPSMFENFLKGEFLAYLKRQFIEIVNETEERVGEYLRTFVEKIVYQDIPKVFPIENEDLLMKIIKIVSSNPGMILDYKSLSNELGISRVTLSNYFFYLEESFLIRKLYNFSKNNLTSEKKMKKFYLSSTSLFTFLNNSVEESKLVENLIVVNTGASFFWRTPQKYEVDIVLAKNNEIIPIEIKYRNSILPKEVKNLIHFSKDFKIQKAVMITKDFSGVNNFKLENDKILEINFIPAWEFLLNYKF